jgi:hypothetical protein
MLNLFYDEPAPDRWLPFDRHPRRLLRRLLRGKPRVGGQRRVFLNLTAGLDRIGKCYRVNDYAHSRRNPATLACIIGKPCVLNQAAWKNPILFGAAGYSHPSDDPNLLDRLAIKKILVPGPWMELMCRPFWGNSVESWPVGIDTELWRPAPPGKKEIDVLIYDKVRWKHDEFETDLIAPIRSLLKKGRHSFLEMRYGYYRETEFNDALSRCRAMIFLCEHETQGIAYQQALSCNVPILAWDRGGYWGDPSYYPHDVTFEPVTSVPYWDERCGRRFEKINEFDLIWEAFWEDARNQRSRPRDFILDNLTLEKCATDYWTLAKSVGG